MIYSKFFINKKKYDNLFYFILGFFLFSSIGFYIVKIKLEYPFFLLEVFLIPFVILKFKKTVKNLNYLVNSYYSFIIFICLLISILLLALLGINNSNDYFGVLALTRNFLYIGIMILIFCKKNKISYNFLFFVSLGAIIGDIIHILIRFQLLEKNVIVDSAIIFNTSNTALFLINSLPIIYRKSMLTKIFVMLISIFIIYLCNYRLLLIVFFISIMFSNLLVLLKFRTKFFYKLLNYLFIILIFFFMFNILINNINQGTVRYYRLYTRTTNLLYGNIFKSSEMNRINKIKSIWNESSYNALPKGFLPACRGIWDCPIGYFFYVFGFPIAIVLLFWITLKGLIFSYWEIKNCSFNVNTSIAVYFIIYVIFLIFNGRFYMLPNESILFGILISRWFRKYNYKF